MGASCCPWGWEWSRPPGLDGLKIRPTRAIKGAASRLALHRFGLGESGGSGGVAWGFHERRLKMANGVRVAMSRHGGQAVRHVVVVAEEDAHRVGLGMSRQDFKSLLESLGGLGVFLVLGRLGSGANERIPIDLAAGKVG